MLVGTSTATAGGQHGQVPVPIPRTSTNGRALPSRALRVRRVSGGISGDFVESRGFPTSFEARAEDGAGGHISGLVAGPFLRR